MKRKVYIICAKEEYEFVYNNIRNLININEEELIVPHKFLQFDSDDLKNKYFYKAKFNHFKNYADDADKFIFICNDLFNLPLDDYEEKYSEMRIALRFVSLNSKKTNEIVYMSSFDEEFKKSR